MIVTTPLTESPQKTALLSRNEWIVLAIVTVATWAFRSVGVLSECVWIDEIWTMQAVTNPKGVIDRCIHIESTPPLYFWLAKLWLMPWGVKILPLRAFSIFAGGFAPVAIYLAARVWRLPRSAAALAVFWIFFHPFAFWQSQDGRVYMHVSVMTWLWLATVPATFDAERPRRMVWRCGLVAFVAFSMHYYFAVVVLGTALGLLAWWLLLDRRAETFGRLALNALWIALCMAALTPLIWLQRNNTPASYLTAPLWAQFVQVFREIYWTGPWCWPGHWAWPLSWRIALILSGAASVLCGWGWFALKAIYGEIDREQARRAGFGIVMAGASVGGLLSVFLFSRWKLPVFMVDRYTLLFLGPFVLFCAIGWSLWPRRAIPFAFPVTGLGLAALGMGAIHTYWTQTQAYDWRETVAIVHEEWRDGDRLLFCPNWQHETYIYNGGETPVPALDSYRPETFGEASRIWLFMWENAPADSGKPGVDTFRAAHPSHLRFEHGSGHTLTLIESQTAIPPQ